MKIARTLWIAWIAWIVSCWCLPSWGQESVVRVEDFEALCPGVLILKGTDLRLTQMENRLVCGDPIPDQIGKPWSEIPPRQAEYFLRVFLQTRGRHSPEFTIIGQSLYVRPGPVSHLTEFEMIDVPPEWAPPRLRLLEGRDLTPALLDELELKVLSGIKDVGYACGEVDALADPETGLVRAEIDSGDRKVILDVLDESDIGLYPGLLDRYNAFQIGGFYSERLVTLTRKRLLDAGLIQAVAFSHDCYPNGVIIHRDPIAGPSRELRFGVGGSTETGVRVRGVARLLRLGPSASELEAVVDVSFVRQEARLVGRWYYSKRDIRDFIEPTILYERLSEPRYESQTIEVSLLHGWSRELATGLGELRIGPTWEIEDIDRGLAPDRVTVTYLESRLNWLSHNAEYFAVSPRDGVRLAIDFVQTKRNWGAPFTSSRARMSGAALWNMFRFDPPLLILGLRYSLGTTWTETGVEPEELPLRFRFFAGGSGDLRGFARQSLPRTGTGALTEATLGLEARAYRALFQRLDPFVFLDAGRLGLKSVRLDKPVYLSPGGGLRWETAFGIFRGFIARGTILNPPPGTPSPDVDWQAGLSLGEEF